MAFHHRRAGLRLRQTDVLAYFVIFMLDDQVLWKRLFSFLWRAVLGCAVAYLMVLTDGTYGKAWQKTLHSVTMARQVGMGWFELTDFVFHVPGPRRISMSSWRWAS